MKRNIITSALSALLLTACGGKEQAPREATEAAPLDSVALQKSLDSMLEASPTIHGYKFSIEREPGSRDSIFIDGRKSGERSRVQTRSIIPHETQ